MILGLSKKRPQGQPSISPGFEAGKHRGPAESRNCLSESDSWPEGVPSLVLPPSRSPYSGVLHEESCFDPEHQASLPSRAITTREVSSPSPEPHPQQTTEAPQVFCPLQVRSQVRLSLPLTDSPPLHWRQPSSWGWGLGRGSPGAGTGLLRLNLRNVQTKSPGRGGRGQSRSLHQLKTAYSTCWVLAGRQGGAFHIWFWLAWDSELAPGFMEYGDSAVRPPSTQPQVQCSTELLRLWAQFSGQATGHPAQPSKVS